MDAVEFLKEKERMCINQTFCSMCPIYKAKRKMTCLEFIEKKSEQAVKIVEEWSKSHPRKTILDDLLEKYPNAQLEIDGTPKFCPVKLGYKTKPCGGKCDICWNTPLEEVE